MTGIVLGFVVATHGVGALAVGVVAATYSPAAIAGITLSSIGIGGLAGFALNRVGKSSNSKSQFKLNDFLKKVLGTDDKTKNLAKIIEKEGLKVDGKVLGQLIAEDKGKDRLIHTAESKDGKIIERAEIKDLSPKNKEIIIRNYKRLQEEEKSKTI